ncbi:MAG: hypothetical protein ACPGNT_00120 [Rhodospirillales bacterium]
MKALPHAGEKHGETVCCAGLTREGLWRRLFPVPFRRLKSDSKFQRWQRISYACRIPKDDNRSESRRIEQEGIKITGKIRPSERARFLTPRILPSVEEAARRGQSLTLIRPHDLRFIATKKSEEEIFKERENFRQAAIQKSFLDRELKELSPCPYKFHFKYKTEDNKRHSSLCDDWETTATFYRRSKTMSDEQAIESMRQTYEIDFANAGVAFAMGTHSKYPKTWLLIGVIRLDEEKQLGFGI